MQYSITLNKGPSWNKNGSVKNDDTTASSGQSSNSQKNKNAKTSLKSGKLNKNRSRRFTAEKRNISKQEDQEDTKSSKWSQFVNNYFRFEHISRRAKQL